MGWWIVALYVLVIIIAGAAIGWVIHCGRFKRENKATYVMSILSLAAMAITCILGYQTYRVTNESASLECNIDGAININKSMLSKHELKHNEVILTVNDSGCKKDSNRYNTLNLRLNPKVKMGKIKAAGLFLGSDESSEVSPVQLKIDKSGKKLSLYGEKYRNVVRGDAVQSKDGVINCYLVLLGSNGQTQCIFARLKPNKKSNRQAYVYDDVGNTVSGVDLCNKKYLELNFPGDSVIEQQMKNALHEMRLVY